MILREVLTFQNSSEDNVLAIKLWTGPWTCSNQEFNIVIIGAEFDAIVIIILSKAQG
jgi:hypothetical protein